MIAVTPFEQLGRFNGGWLDAHYHFSFADYLDRNRMGVGALRVWNDDRVLPHTGFDMHPHRDFEIITYLRRGAVTHQDSLGNRGVTRAGQVQVMSAGRGIVHSEHNLEDEDLELFQIWIRPNALGVEPRWETRSTAGGANGGLATLVSGRADAPDDALFIHADAELRAGVLAAGETAIHTFGTGRHAYLVPARGTTEVNGTTVPTRAGVYVTDVDAITIRAVAEAEVVLVDVP